MNSGDLYKVWEIRALKRKPKAEEAQKILERIASQVRPIMRKHNWRVKLLSEMRPKNGRLLGYNVGGGVHVKLTLRMPNRDEAFIPFDEVLDTMLHELCHNAHGPHNTSFYKLWDELRTECEELINKGITGPGRRLGGLTPQPPLSSLRQTALVAAKNRVRLASLLPSGSKCLGGDRSMMAALSPVQAAAMAAERRLRDNLWCASESCDASADEEGENNDPIPSDMVDSSGNSRGFSSSDAQASNKKSLKRKQASSDMTTYLPHNGKPGSKILDTENGTSRSPSRVCHNGVPSKQIPRPDILPAPSSNTHSQSSGADLSSYTSPSISDGESTMWECRMCTFLNSPFLPICELCSSLNPRDVDGKQKLWACKFCTMDNVGGSERCAACEEWRYSHGPPALPSVPNGGTR